MENPERGTPLVKGILHASAFTSTTTRGGKDMRPSSPGLFFKPLEPLLEEPLSPLRDYFSSGVQPLGYLLVLHPLSCV